VGEAVAHPLLVHGASRERARERARELLEEVGLAPAERYYGLRPAELSGGQKQRVVIARAVATRPRLLVADEPVSMLDMSVRARVLELLLELKRRYDLTLVFITHDLATARFLGDRIAIMYLGKVVEVGDAKAILARPEHPYAKALVAAVPSPDPAARRTEEVPPGEVPDAMRPPAGCRFHPRCPVATPACGHTGADLRDITPEIPWRVDGKDAVWRAAPPDAEARARALALERRPVVWEAIAETQRGPEGLRTSFLVPRRIGMRRRPDGRQVRCILYEDQGSGA
jgi:peptide/nickel transport system ATP-binding protein